MAVDAIILAGGRITGRYARATGTPVKALATVAGVPLLRRVLTALRATAGIGRICLVGPESAGVLGGDEVVWEREAGTALGNLQAGLDRLGPGGEARVLLCASDLPLLEAAALQDFLDRAPAGADVALPVVRREAFVAAFPGNWGIYVRLADGTFTAGSQLLVRPSALHANQPLVRRLFEQRKSQLAMARTLVAGTIWRLVTRRLTVAEIEARGEALTGCRCAAVLDCRPELAFDVDNLLDLRYVERWVARRERESRTPERVPHADERS
jgi:GTP:adenosylcobinamide-phosphate guanylyltransferase